MERKAAADEVRFSIVVEADVAPEVLRRYWAGSIDKYGRPHHDESIASIAEDLGVSVPEVTRLAKATGYGLRPSWRCHECDGPWPLRTRRAQGPQRGRCERCLAGAAEAGAAERAAAAALQARRAALLWEHLGRGPEDKPVRLDLGEITALSLRDTIALLAWTLAADPDGILPDSEEPLGVFADPTTAEHLRGLGLVHLDPSSPLRAFDWADDLASVPERVDSAAAKFHLPGSGPVGDRTTLARTELFNALHAPWPSHWADSAVETTRDCMVGEVVRHMSGWLRRHRMETLSANQHERLCQTARLALESFTLGQCFTMTKSGVNTASSAKLQRPQMSAAAVTGCAINGCADYLESALGGDWDVFEYDRHTNTPPSIETETLAFILGVQTMSMGLASAREAARRRT
jgi:hypothetical protein